MTVGLVNTEEAGETTVQFKLHRLVIQKQQQSALDIFITRSLYLMRTFEENRLD